MTIVTAAPSIHETGVLVAATRIPDELGLIFNSPDPVPLGRLHHTTVAIWGVSPWFDGPWAERGWLESRDRLLDGFSLALARWWPKPAKTRDDPRDAAREMVGPDAFHREIVPSDVLHRYLPHPRNDVLKARAIVLRPCLAEVGYEMVHDFANLPARNYVRLFVSRTRERAAVAMGGWRRKRTEDREFVSLDEPGENGGPTMLDLLPAPEVNPLLEHELGNYLRCLVAVDPARRRGIVPLLLGADELGLAGHCRDAWVGERLGVSPSRVRDLRAELRRRIMRTLDGDSPLSDLASFLCPRL